eukprot:jgi/Mesvir1/161/Mv13520-RA.1
MNALEEANRPKTAAQVAGASSHTPLLAVVSVEEAVRVLQKRKAAREKKGQSTTRLLDSVIPAVVPWREQWSQYMEQLAAREVVHCPAGCCLRTLVLSEPR